MQGVCLFPDLLEHASCRRQSIREQQRTLLEQSKSNTDRNANLLQVLEGVIDVEMRNAEMRRILSQDPSISKALAKMEEDQRKAAAGLESTKQHHSVIGRELDQPPETIENSRQANHNATTDA